jgi:hypothetical protein
MADTASRPESGDETGLEPDRGSITGTPRWVKVFGIVALVLVLAFIILHLTGRGFSHGDHTGSGEDAPGRGHSGHTPPEAGHR